MNGIIRARYSVLDNLIKIFIKNMQNLKCNIVLLSRLSILKGYREETDISRSDKKEMIMHLVFPEQQ